MLPGHYDIGISDKVVSQFNKVNDDITYWVALESDDRIDPFGGAMWVRGGIVAGTRDRQWYLSKGNIDEAFDRCKEISLKVEDAKGKRKAKEGK